MMRTTIHSRMMLGRVTTMTTMTTGPMLMGRTTLCLNLSAPFSVPSAQVKVLITQCSFHTTSGT